MTLLLDRDLSHRGADERPELGVIEEARTRQRRRRVRGAAVVILGVLVGTGALLLGGVSGGGSRAGSRPGGSTRPLAPRIRAASNAGGVRVAPALEGGSYGWNVFYGQRATCCATPVQGNPLAGGFTIEVNAHYELLTFLAGPELAAVMVNGHRVPVTTLPGDLPFHLQLVQAKIARRPGVNSPPPTAPAAPGVTPTLVPLDTYGHVIPTVAEANRRATIRWWQRPSGAPSGPCRLRSRGISALTPKWGHVASAILPSPDRIVGRAFFSCIDTEYYLHGWPLVAAILLDAARPGTPPAAIPGLQPMASAPGYSNGPGDFHGDLTATHLGNAWLVVAGGSGPAQRLAVLRHLHARIRL